MAGIGFSSQQDTQSAKDTTEHLFIQEYLDESKRQAEYRREFLASFTAEEERKIMRKVGMHIVIIVDLIYSIKQIDTNNTALAKVMARGKPTNILNQLRMTQDQYAWVKTAYYIPYVLLETPTVMLFKKMSPRLFQARIIITWGALLACHAAVRSRNALYASRVLLGNAEAGMFPAIMTFYTCWYRGDELARPMIWLHGTDSFSPRGMCCCSTDSSTRRMASVGASA
ncbi:hypothetical protein NW762_013968 [Fusarium torreyae]|uniref:Uncharacterized protein n=1 Tax=Fusarium torreyae TaxID=1237075 RepID=A0A9W8V853_9HYPO|nr:hypothetical protein NW762_013968 [Fusarium torreyae]